MAANRSTTNPAVPDGSRRRPANKRAARFARRLSHDPGRLRRQESTPRAKGVARAVSTDLSVYTPPPRATNSPPERWQIHTQLYYSVALAVHRLHNRPPKVKTAKVIAVVPAHNEESSIARTLKALLGQTRPPDRIVVVADNCSDKTVGGRPALRTPRDG
jgi:Glycosyl transferase family 2